MYCSNGPNNGSNPGGGRIGKKQTKKTSKHIGFYILVVSSGHFHIFYAFFFPLGYIPAVPPHSTYIIDNGFGSFKVKSSRKILAPLFSQLRAGKTIVVYIYMDIYGIPSKSRITNDICRMMRYSWNILQWEEERE